MYIPCSKRTVHAQKQNQMENLERSLFGRRQALTANGKYVRSKIIEY